MRDDKLKHCEKCGQPMISAGTVCKRVGCSPEFFDEHNSVRAGERGKFEVQLFTGDKLQTQLAPASKVFYFWACAKSSWARLARGLQDIRDIQRHMYRAPHGCREFIGRLSNAAQKHCRSKVVYRSWDIVREIVDRSHYTFARQMVAESLRDVAARDVDYAADLEYARSNYELYLRDKAAARG